MRQLDQVCESPDSESIQCALDFENTMNNLETQLYYRHLPPKEVALRVMEAACKFYDADWCGLIQVDLDLNLWKPFWWYNDGPEDKTTTLTNEFESAEFLNRWVKNVRKGSPMVVPDAEESKTLSRTSIVYTSVWVSNLCWQFRWSRVRLPWLPCATPNDTSFKPVCSNCWPMCCLPPTTTSG